jgi:hypothetical protein
MLKRTILSLPLLPLTMTPGSGFAQSQEATKTVEPQKFYKLEFVVKEVEGGKVLNARTYTTTQIRAGSKVPYQTGMGDSKSFQYCVSHHHQHAVRPCDALGVTDGPSEHLEFDDHRAAEEADVDFLIRRSGIEAPDATGAYGDANPITATGLRPRPHSERGAVHSSASSF